MVPIDFEQVTSKFGGCKFPAWPFRKDHDRTNLFLVLIISKGFKINSFFPLNMDVLMNLI